MLKRITTEFGMAVKVIVDENLNVIRSFIRDVRQLFSRLAQPLKKGTTA